MTSVRNRGSRPVVGQAIERPAIGTLPGGGNIFVFDPWNFYYYGGYGYNYRYGCSWCYGARYYDPFGYWNDPFYPFGYSRHYYPYPYDPSYGYGGYGASRRDYDDTPRREMGSLRVKANRGDAKIYIDGVLVGVVDDFDGLTDHLELEAGPHQMEVRADGYQTLVKDINVKSGKTMTERLKLKKN